MESITMEIELQLADDDSIITEVDVEYEIIKAQPDCGVMNDVIEIYDVILPSDYVGLKHPEAQKKDPIFIGDLEDKIREEYFYGF